MVTLRNHPRAALATATIVLTLLAAVACSQPAAPAPPAGGAPAPAAKPAAQPMTLRLTQAIGPTTSRGVGTEAFAKRINELTNGQVTVQVFHNAALGSEDQSIQGLQNGSIDLGVIATYSNAVKAGLVFDLPFLWSGLQHWEKGVYGKPGQMVMETAPGVGLRMIGYWNGGYREVYGSRQINGVADFKGLKIRTQQTASYVDLFTLIGAIPSPISWTETYLALQQKTVDASETSLAAMYDAKQYEVTKYVALTNHAMTAPAFLVSEQRWKALPENVQQAIVAAEKAAREVQRQVWEKEETDTVALLKEKGMIFNTPDTAPIREVAKSQVYTKNVTDATQKAVLAEVAKIQ